MRISTLLLVLPGLAFPVGMRADQQPTRSTETVSREVMTLLMSGPGMTSGQFELRVGAAPETFPAELLPPGTTIEASASAPGTATVVGANASLTISDLTAQLPRVAAAGWSNAGPPIRGFVSRAASMALAVCRNQEFAVIGFAPREAGGVYARVAVRQEPRQVCGSRPDFNFPDVTIPVLVAPPDATIAGGGGSGGGVNDLHSRSHIETAAPLHTVMEHYVTQVERAGWTESGRLTQGNEIAVTRFRTTSRLGDAVTAVLVITRLGTGNGLDLMLHVVRDQPSSGPASSPAGVIQGGIRGDVPGGGVIRPQ